ncbi:MAG: hypothetical protein CME65_08735 [Halobacteriovoraceae bacterium]|nr:hypothetical protein [Halobacteriovoraceae bacterium]|tara:strand:+ start:3904 stop:4281 length:378 start_codon:yes stop_codon:yes gene_type:complete
MGEENSESLSILVVEDDPILRDLLIEELNEAGFSCTPAGSGDEAWAIMEKSSVDCLISDLAMQDSSGADLIEKTRKDSRFKSLPIIISSGVLDITEEKALKMGANKLFIKPFLVEDLVRSIQEIS